MVASRKLTRFVAFHEGFLAYPYAAAIDAAGVVTQGFGTTNLERPSIHLGGPKVSRRKAKRWLRASLDHKLDDIEAYLKHYATDRVRRHEIEGLASFAYNNGLRAVTDPSYSTLAKRLAGREGRTFHGRKRIYRQEMKRWVYDGNHVKQPGLVARRENETRLACKGDYRPGGHR